MAPTTHDSTAAATALSIPVSVPQVRRWLLMLVALLVAAHIAGQFSEHILDKPNLKGFVPRTNMNGELSVPPLIATLLLVACAGLLAVITYHAHRTGDRFTRWWCGLVLLFAYAAADEAIALHEATIDPIRDLLGVTEGWLFFAWVIPAGMLLLILAFMYRSWLFSLPTGIRNQFILAAVLFASGALGVELLSGWYLSVRGDDFIYELIGAVEETLEFLGVIIFLTALLTYLGQTAGEVRVQLAPESPSNAPRPDA
jgi:hypothetical protein